MSSFFLITETPLTLATGVKSKTARLIMSLINGGAIIDFRTKDGSTAMHSAVIKNNCEALRTLLDLGASPNYKDAKGLTPLYLTVTQSADVDLMDTLLHDHAQIGLADLQGWQEVHQVIKMMHKNVYDCLLILVACVLIFFLRSQTRWPKHCLVGDSRHSIFGHIYSFDSKHTDFIEFYGPLTVDSERTDRAINWHMRSSLNEISLKRFLSSL